MINQSQLKEMLHYNPETGLFVWIVSNKRNGIGDIAGCSDANGYITIGVEGKKYSAHRLAYLYMEGVLPDNYVRHINRFRDDNRWCNLVCRAKVSTLPHVRWYSPLKKWRAEDGEGRFQGYFDDAEEANQAVGL